MSSNTASKHVTAKPRNLKQTCKNHFIEVRLRRYESRRAQVYLEVSLSLSGMNEVAVLTRNEKPAPQRGLQSIRINSDGAKHLI